MADRHTEPPAATTMCCSCIPSFLFSRKPSSGLPEPLAPANRDSERMPSLSDSEPSAAALVDSDGLDAAARRRITKILDEVLHTERTYVAALGALSTSFLPILKPHLDASQGEAAELLSTASALYGVHRELLERLEIAGDDMWAVARAFALMTPFLRMYSTYCGGDTRALSRVAEVRRTHPALSELEMSRGELLDSLLIRPVQRLCKYPLFFAELLRPLPSSGGLRRELEGAAHAVRQVSEEVNARTKGVADGARLIQLHHELSGKVPALLAPTRSLLLELDLRLSVTKPRRTPTAGTSSTKHRLVLLSDAIILAKIRRPPAALRALSSLTRGSKRRENKDGGVTQSASTNDASVPPLKLLAVLPLSASTLQLAAPTRTKRAAASDAVGSTHKILLSCTEPAVRYTCKCVDSAAAARLLEATRTAQEGLAETTKRSERRASLVAPVAAAAESAAVTDEAGGEDGAADSLLASVERHRTRRRSWLGLPATGRRNSTATDGVGSAAAAAAAVSNGSWAVASTRSSTRAAAPPPDGDDGVARDSDGIPLGLIGLLCDSDGGSDSEGSSRSDCTSASEVEDD